MMKKYLIIFTIVLLSALAVIVYYTRDDIAFSKEVSVYKAVPITTPLFIEFKSLKSMKDETAIFNALETSGVAASFFNFSKKINEIIENIFAFAVRCGSTHVGAISQVQFDLNSRDTRLTWILYTISIGIFPNCVSQ